MHWCSSLPRAPHNRKFRLVPPLALIPACAWVITEWVEHRHTEAPMHQVTAAVHVRALSALSLVKRGVRSTEDRLQGS